MERKTFTSANRPGPSVGTEESENIFSASAASSPGKAGALDDEMKALKSDLESLKVSLANLTSKAASNTLDVASTATSKVTDSVTGAAGMIAEKSSDIATAASKGAQSLFWDVTPSYCQ